MTRKIKALWSQAVHTVPARNHTGSVIPGKAGDEVLAGGLFLPGVFHQVQNLGHGGLLAGPGDPHPQEARLVYAAADHIVPGFHVPGHGLAGEGGGVQGGDTLQHRAVQGHPLAGLHHDDGPHLHVLRVCLLQGTVLPLQVGGVGADIHQGGDGLAGAAHGIVLKQLTHLVEEHDEDGLGALAGGEGAHGGQGHEEVLVEDLAVSDVAGGLPQDVPANDPIGDQIEQKPEGGPAVQRVARCRPPGGRGPLAGEIDDPAVRRINLIRQQPHGNQQRRGGEDSKQHFPLFAGEIFHGERLLRKSEFPSCNSSLALLYWRQSDGRFHRLLWVFCRLPLVCQAGSLHFLSRF